MSLFSLNLKEVIPPKVTDFAKSADDGYTNDQIKKMEQTMLKALEW